MIAGYRKYSEQRQSRHNAPNHGGMEACRWAALFPYNQLRLRCDRIKPGWLMGLDSWSVRTCPKWRRKKEGGPVGLDLRRLDGNENGVLERAHVLLQPHGKALAAKTG